MTRNEILKIIDEEIINKDENIDVDKLEEYLQLFESTVKILKIFKRKDEFNFIQNVYNEISKINSSFICQEKRDIINTMIEQNWCHSIYKHYETVKLWNILEISLEKEKSKLLFGIYTEDSDAIVLDKLRNNETKIKKLFNDIKLENTESYLYCWYIDTEKFNDYNYVKEIADNILKLDNILSNL
ncbi:hypothetical protein [uncultured Brachyspira sp.]|uniref:hypothetical protein n=1 Tax=uncultured Brachyspira sp. TaxID=221953 RepID=UPI0026321A8C|nr:hypothetical protein [uncultured Brachyspira sp.]